MIRLVDLHLKQDAFELAGICLQVEVGQYAILMGQTGCGKTSLLEAICGLRPVSGGEIWLGDDNVTHWPIQNRNIGYVPQDAVLFPGMRIDRQIDFPLRLRRSNRQTCEQRIGHLGELLEIQHLLKRTPEGLSGGEKQRVALARAIAFHPTILCLDEPLSALDQSTHGRMLDLLKRIHQEEKLTVLHVTHNHSETNHLATQSFQIRDGKISKLGPGRLAVE